MATFHIHTFGCKVNQCDSQIIRETLASWNFAEADADAADLIVINTCTVTNTADSKFRKALRKARRENPRAAIVVTGCFATKPGASHEDVPQADLLFGTRDLGSLTQFLLRKGLADSGVPEEAHAQSYFAEHTRAFLKIQDGCDCFCAYCIVPIVRPQLWSEEPDTVIAVINDLSRRGYREVVLTGIHLGFYRRDAESGALAHLLRRIEDECDIERVRLSSIEINEISDELLSIVADSERFCHHLHLPLQSGDDEILVAMGRRYSRDFFINRVEEIRDKIPDIGISTDVIVGFPGETHEQFEHTVDIVENVRFVKTHVFRFSSRPGTRAAEMDAQVPAREVSSRARHMIEVAGDAAGRFKERFKGAIVSVLPETFDSRNNTCTGLSSNYIRIKILDASMDCLNTIVPVELTRAGTRKGAATGKLITEKQGGLENV